VAKTLTAAAVKNYRPGKVRREIPDGGAPGLHLLIQPSGAKTWAVRFRRPDGRPAKLTLGSCDAAVGEEVEAEPVIGGHLTLASARRLAAEVHRQRAMGRDVIADHAAAKHRRRAEGQRRAANTFGEAARDSSSSTRSGEPAGARGAGGRSRACSASTIRRAAASRARSRAASPSGGATGR
jgi:hypothetical protein